MQVRPSSSALHCLREKAGGFVTLFCHACHQSTVTCPVPNVDWRSGSEEYLCHIVSRGELLFPSSILAGQRSISQ